LTPPILQENLQRIKNENQYSAIKKILLSLDTLFADPIDSSISAAELYRELRKSGITIKKPNDCLIAWYGIYNRVKLVHRHDDFEKIAAHTSLKTFKF